MVPWLFFGLFLGGCSWLGERDQSGAEPSDGSRVGVPKQAATGKKYALIINGDEEPRHVGNVDTAIQALRAEGPYDISVSSIRAPEKSVEHFGLANRKGLDQLVSGLKGSMGPQDLLTVYVTGHGDTKENGEGCFTLTDGCRPFADLKAQLDQVSYAKRIMVMDGCFAGGSLKLFADPKTTVVTQGSPGEPVSCQTFSPYFWGTKVPDGNGDGMISLLERYAYSLQKGQTDSHTQFYQPTTEKLGLSGKVDTTPNFPAEVVTVHRGSELKEQLKKLQPGQLALVTFSADWCGPCQKYRPHFEKLAKKYAGQFLMIHAEGVAGSEEDWREYGAKAYPTVSFVDFRGHALEVEDRNQPIVSLAAYASSVPQDRLGQESERLKSPYDSERESAIKTLSVMGRSDPKGLLALLDHLKGLDDEAVEEKKALSTALAKMGPALQPMLPELWKNVEGTDPLAAKNSLFLLGTLAREAEDAASAFKILAFVENPDPQLRQAALEVVGEIPLASIPVHEDLVPYLKRKETLLYQSLGDENSQVRASAVRAIASSTALRIKEGPLLSMLQDPDPEVRRATVELFGKLKFNKSGEWAMPALIQSLDDAETEVVVSAISSLKRFGAQALPAVPKLLTLLEANSDSELDPELEPELLADRLKGIDFFSLQKFKSRVNSLPAEWQTLWALQGALKQIAQESPAAQVRIVRALAQAPKNKVRFRQGLLNCLNFYSVNFPAVYPTLRKLAMDAEESARVQANGALLIKGHGADFFHKHPAALMDLLNSPSEEIRKAALSQLSSLDSKVLPLLPKLLKILNGRFALASDPSCRSETEGTIALREWATLQESYKVPVMSALEQLLSHSDPQVRVIAQEALDTLKTCIITLRQDISDHMLRMDFQMRMMGINPDELQKHLAWIEESRKKNPKAEKAGPSPEEQRLRDVAALQARRAKIEENKVLIRGIAADVLNIHGVMRRGYPEEIKAQLKSFIGDVLFFHGIPRLLPPQNIVDEPDPEYFLDIQKTSNRELKKQYLVEVKGSPERSVMDIRHGIQRLKHNAKILDQDPEIYFQELRNEIAAAEPLAVLTLAEQMYSEHLSEISFVEPGTTFEGEGNFYSFDDYREPRHFDPEPKPEDKSPYYNPRSETPPSWGNKGRNPVDGYGP